MYWLWITVSMLVVFAGIWLYKGANYFSHDRFKRLMSKIVSVIIASDGVFTLIDQPYEYWSIFLRAVENTVIGLVLLQWHPVAFAISIIAWIIFTSFVIQRARVLFSCTAFFALFLGHLLGALDRLGVSVDWTPFYNSELLKYLFYLAIGFILSIVIQYARRLK